MRIIPFLLLASSLFAHAGVLGKPAPELRVDKWVNLPEKTKKGPLLHKDWKGKVVYLYFFQSWCPGCHSSGFPTLKNLEGKFRKNPDVKFATVQTVFEGFSTNNEAAAKKIVERYQLQNIPVGQSGSHEARSKVMAAFQTRGTPWTVIIGKDGKVAFEGFHLKPEEGQALINKLLKSSS